MRHLGGIGALIAVTVAAYWGVHEFRFVDFDDDVYLVDNETVRGGLTLDTIRWAFTTGHHSNWHPLTWLSYLAEIELAGLDPGVMHATNLALHLLVCALLYALLWRTTHMYGPSLFVALLFALHPLHVEAVAWISERKELLAALFGLLAIHAYISYARVRSAPMYALLLVAFAASLMSKAMWVTLPVLLLAFDAWPLKRTTPLRDRVVEKIPLLLIAIAAGLITIAVQRGGDSVQTLETVPLEQRLGNAVLAYAYYLFDTVWPAGLAIFYPHPREDISWPLVAFSAILLAAITAAAFRLRRTSPAFAFGWTWFVVALLPVIGILQVGGQAHADRYTYMPHIGLFAGVVFALASRVEIKRPAFGLAGAAIVAVCAALCFAQVRHWRDTETVFERALAVTTDNVLAHAVLARHYLDRGAYPSAEDHARKAVAINGEFATGCLDLGLALHEQQKYREAETALDRFLALRPDSPTGLFYRAKTLAAQADPAARAAFARAVERDRENAVVRTAYGNYLARAAVNDGDGLLSEAAEQYMVALEHDPDYALAHLNLGRALTLLGRSEEAKSHLETAQTLLAAAGVPQNGE